MARYWPVHVHAGHGGAVTFRQPLTVHYRDGTSMELYATQYALGRFSQYIAEKGWRYDPNQPGIIALLQLRYMAWAELMRDSPRRQTFETWDASVDEVEGEQAQQADPTQPAMSAGS